MIDAFRRAAERSDIVLVSGGLGPTRDDLTSAVLAQAFGRAHRLDPAVLETIRAFFRSVGREMSENNAQQAWFPEGAEVLPNPIGTAPGFLLEQGRALFFCMPGVPRELERMLREQVLPRIAARRGGGAVVRAKLLRTFGMGESSLDDELKDIAASGDVTLGFRTAFPDNYLRPVARAPSAELAEAKLAEVCAAIRQRLGPLVYGEGEETMQAVVGRLLREQGKTLAVAESCTGGLLAEQISEVPGASAVFQGRRGGLRERGQDGAARRVRGAARAARRGVGRGGARDGGGGEGALRGGSRRRHHRHLGSRRRHRREARGPGARGAGPGGGHHGRRLRVPARPRAPSPAQRAPGPGLGAACAARRSSWWVRR